MISYIRGMLADKSGELIVVEASQVGMGIHVPLTVLSELPPIGEEVKIYTYLQVREDDLSLYGFLSRSDLEMFKQLIGVNGIGPKAALGILSTMSPDRLRMAILTGDVKAIVRAPGIGSKTAQRLILDLKDKVKSEEILTGISGTLETEEDKLNNEAAKEAAQALIALGYTNAEAAKAVKQVKDTEELDAEGILKASLKYLI